jgi:hypothetical protein
MVWNNGRTLAVCPVSEENLVMSKLQFLAQLVVKNALPVDSTTSQELLLHLRLPLPFRAKAVRKGGGVYRLETKKKQRAIHAALGLLDLAFSVLPLKTLALNVQTVYFQKP